MYEKCSWGRWRWNDYLAPKAQEMRMFGRWSRLCFPTGHSLGWRLRCSHTYDLHFDQLCCPSFWEHLVHFLNVCSVSSSLLEKQVNSTDVLFIDVLSYFIRLKATNYADNIGKTFVYFINRYLSYGSGPKRFPLVDVLQYALEFASSKPVCTSPVDDIDATSSTSGSTSSQSLPR